jgi:hypothetical protein
MLRYRLVDEKSNDLGPYVSPRRSWKPGDRFEVRAGHIVELVDVVEAGTDEFAAYLVVRRA